LPSCESISRAATHHSFLIWVFGVLIVLTPNLGLYLTDLTFIEDGNPDLIEGGLINWVKRRRLANVIKDIQQYQQKPYCLEEVSFIQDYLLNYVLLNEDEAYKLSLQLETRTPEKEPKKPLFGGKKDGKEKSAPASPQVQYSLSDCIEDFVQFVAGYLRQNLQYNLLLLIQK
jgi:hypothetical protein